MTREVYNKFYDNYYEDYTTVGVSLEFHPDDDFEQIHGMIAEDLDDKGFTEDEIDEILNEKPCLKTQYKFIAYAVSLYHEFYDINELKTLLDEMGHNLDDFTDDDLNSILTERQHVDF